MPDSPDRMTCGNCAYKDKPAECADCSLAPNEPIQRNVLTEMVALSVAGLACVVVLICLI